MKTTHTLVSRIALVATVAVGFSLQACGGAGPEGQSVEKSSQDLTLFGIPVPAPTLTVGLGDKSATIDPIGTIDKLIPDAGITLPDPLAPLNNIINTLDNGLTVGFTAPGLEIGLTLPGLPIELPTLPDPFADGGITIIGK
jgi:hypothetical protein